MSIAADTLSTNAGRPLRAALWLAQLLVALPFAAFGIMKLTRPIPLLSQMMPWTATLPEPFVRLMGMVDLAGAVGLILPAITRIRPELTRWAALGCICLQIAAGIFHISRGEAEMLPINVVFLLLSAFIFWGRSPGRAPIDPR